MPNAETPTFYAFELVRDNQARTVTSAEFREDFKNDNESFLDQANAPSDMYIAKTLGQQSLIYGEVNQNVLLGTYDSAV